MNSQQREIVRLAGRPGLIVVEYWLWTVAEATLRTPNVRTPSSLGNQSRTQREHCVWSLAEKF